MRQPLYIVYIYIDISDLKRYITLSPPHDLTYCYIHIHHLCKGTIRPCVYKMSGVVLGFNKQWPRQTQVLDIYSSPQALPTYLHQTSWRSKIGIYVFPFFFFLSVGGIWGGVFLIFRRYLSLEHRVRKHLLGYRTA